MKVQGKAAEGIGTHATSLISYKLPTNHSFVSFKASGALDDGGVHQGACGSQIIIRANGVDEDLEYAAHTEVKKGDRLVIKTPGGGGCGGL